MEKIVNLIKNYVNLMAEHGFIQIGNSIDNLYKVFNCPHILNIPEIQNNLAKKTFNKSRKKFRKSR